MIHVNKNKDVFEQVNLAMKNENFDNNIKSFLHKINYLYQHSVETSLISYETFFKYQLSEYYVYFNDEQKNINIENGQVPLNSNQYLFMSFKYNKIYSKKFNNSFLSFFKKEIDINEMSNIIQKHYSKVVVQIQKKFLDLMNDKNENEINLMVHVNNHQIPFYNVDDSFFIRTLQKYFRKYFSNNFNENFLLSKLNNMELDLIFNKYINHGLVSTEHAGDDGSFDVSTIFRYLTEENRSKLLRKFAKINKFTRTMFDYSFDNEYVEKSFSKEEKKNVLNFIMNKISTETILTDNLFYNFLLSLTNKDIYVNVTSQYNILDARMEFIYIIQEDFFKNINTENLMNYSERAHNYIQTINLSLKTIINNKQSVIVENYYNIKKKIKDLKAIINLFPNYDLNSEIYNDLISIEKILIKLSFANTEKFISNTDKIIFNNEDTYYSEEYDYNPLKYIPMKSISI